MASGRSSSRAMKPMLSENGMVFGNDWAKRA